MTLSTITGPLNVLDGIQINGVPVTAGGQTTVDEITDATAIGKNLLKASDQNAAQTIIGAMPSTYVPTWDEITSKPATFPPTIGTTATTAKAGDYVPGWAEITGKPATFPPEIGTTATTAKAGNYVPAWTEITGKPTTFPPEIGTTATTAMAGNTAIPAPSAVAGAALAAAGAAGSSAAYARADHVHPLPTDAALQVAAFTSDGGALSFPGGTLAAALKAIADLADPGA